MFPVKALVRRKNHHNLLRACEQAAKFFLFQFECYKYCPFSPPPVFRERVSAEKIHEASMPRGSDFGVPSLHTTIGTEYVLNPYAPQHYPSTAISPS